MKKRSWKSEDLKKAVEESYSFRQVLIKLNLRPVGGNYATIQKYIQADKLNITHFKGKGWNRGLTGIGIPRVKTKDILVRNSNFQSYKVKQRLFKESLIPKKCEECGWAEKSKSGHLPLELDHINGDRRDNRLSNLRILCPNCHSLKSTYRARKH